ncbi:MAG: LysR family transcriptional regulator [Eubacterium sp.]|nr:LysR family transcriptional regulator [Eubacterium sp.]
MELTKLEYFKAVATNYNMQYAAEQLNVSQSTISMAVKSLEKELEVELFHRRGRKLELTEAGTIFLAETNKILDQVEESLSTMNKFRNSRQRRFNFISEAIDYTNRMVMIFNILYPQYCLSQQRRSDEDIISLLLSEKVDAAVTFEDYSDENISSVLLSSEPICLLANEKEPVARKKEITLKEVENCTVITVDNDRSMNNIAKPYYHIHKIHPLKTVSVPAPESIPFYVEYMLGVGLITPSTFEVIKNHFPSVVAIPITDSDFRWDVYLTLNKNHKLSAAERNFCRILKEFGKYVDEKNNYPGINEMKPFA